MLESEPNYREPAMPTPTPPDMSGVDEYIHKLNKSEARWGWINRLYIFLDRDWFFYGVVLMILALGILSVIRMSQRSIECRERGGMYIQNQCMKVERILL